MQTALAENCCNANWDSLMNFQQYAGRPAQEGLQMFVPGGELNNVNFDAEMNDVVKESFINTKKFFRMGVLSCFFYFTTFFALLIGAVPLLAATFPD